MKWKITGNGRMDRTRYIHDITQKLELIINENKLAYNIKAMVQILMLCSIFICRMLGLKVDMKMYRQEIYT